jgi:hypothetical protein
VEFQANLTGDGQAILTGSGNELSTLYDTTGKYTMFLEPSPFNNEGNVAFHASLSGGGEGIFRGDGEETITIADLSGPFSGFGNRTSLNDNGMVAFYASLKAGGQEIVIGDGKSFTTVAATGDIFGGFSTVAVAINNDGVVAFRADLSAGGSAIFTGSDSVADRVVAVGDSLFGSTVEGFLAGAGFTFRGLNNKGRLTFVVNLSDGRQAIVRADPDEASPAPSRFRQPASFAVFVIPGASNISPVASWTMPELRSESALSGITLQLVTHSPSQPTEFARPQSAPSAFACAAHRSVVDLAFADFDSSSEGDRFMATPCGR